MEIQKFSPAKLEIQTAVEKVKGLTIKGIEDEQGYLDVKTARKTLGDYRIDITKFGKKQRQEALDYQREVLRQEKELLVMIEPEETRLKNELEKIDEEKKIIARRVLLPTRTKMLEDIKIKLLDAEILGMDEKEFSAYYTEQKMLFDQNKEAERLRKEQEKQQKADFEKQKKEAVKIAVKAAEEKAEIEKKEALDKLREDQENFAKKEKEALEKKQADIEAKKAQEKVEKEKQERSRKYINWLKNNGCDREKLLSLEFIVQQNGDKRILYKKVSEFNS
jgi:hypothetical protein